MNQLPRIVKDSFLRLIVPYVVFSFLGHLFYVLILLFENQATFYLICVHPLKEFILRDAIAGNRPMWFLFSLFIIRILYSFFNCKKIHDIYIIIIGIALSLTLHIYHVSFPNILGQVCLGCSFYATGHLLKTKQYQLHYTIRYFLLAICIFNLTSTKAKIGFVNNSSESTFTYIIALFYSLSCCILFNVLARRIVGRGGFSWITLIGKDSMSFYCTHWIVIVVFRTVLLEWFHLDNTEYFNITICILVATLPAINYLLKKQHWVKV